MVVSVDMLTTSQYYNTPYINLVFNLTNILMTTWNSSKPCSCHNYVLWDDWFDLLQGK